MVPRIVTLGAAGGLVTLVFAIGSLFLPLPYVLRGLLFLVFAAFFVASVAIFGRIVVAEGD